MNLTWHIVRKDLRRLFGPWAGWLVLVGLGTVWIRLVGWDGANREITAATSWIGGVGWMAQVLGFGIFALQGALVGALVLDDRTTGSDAWWMTRPVSGGRLLAAKLITAALLFVVAPVAVSLALSAVGDVGAAPARSVALGVLWTAGWVVVAAALAALTANLGQMLFAASVWTGLMWTAVLGVVVYRGTSGAADPAQMQLRVEWASVWPWAALVAALAWQFRTRRTRTGWGLVAGGLAAAALFNLAWPERLLPAPVKPARTPAEAAVTVDLKTLVTPANRNVPHALFLEIGGDAGPGAVFAPVEGKGELRWADGGRVPVTFGRGGLWGDQAAMRVAGARSGSGPVRWDMAMRVRGGADERLRAGAATFAGTLTLARLRATVAVSGPLREGWSAGDGPWAMRVIGWASSRETALLVEERTAGAMIGGVGFAGRHRQSFETYLLVHAERAITKALHIRDLGAAAVNGVALRLLALETTAPMRTVEGRRIEAEGWRDGATLVRVRFEDAEYFERTVTDLPLTLTTEDPIR